MRGKKTCEAVEFNVVCNCKVGRQSGTRGGEQRTVRKGVEKNRAATEEEEREGYFDRLLVLRRDSCQREGESRRLHRLFVAETE